MTAPRATTGDTKEARQGPVLEAAVRLEPEIAEHAVARTPASGPGVLQQRDGQREVAVQRAQQRRRQRDAAEVQVPAEGPAPQRHASRPPA
ncbi:hypothetical protein PUR_29780 [Paenibacillus sp. URB8-2]|nr:hypothetical protein PUR_29780 [Paenibacillus sp. URB8-2]